MMRRATTRLAPAAAMVLSTAWLLCAAPARAQSADDKAAAEALFDDGKKLFLAKKYAEACPKLESSQKLDPGIGTLLYLADCYEGLGRVASAWATFRDAAAQAKAAGQGERDRVARQRASQLEPKLYRLTLDVTAPDTPGLKVQRNDSEVKKAVWGSAVPVDPGTYTITASAPGKKTWTGKVQIPDGPGAQAFAIPALEDAPAEAPPPPPPPPPKVTEPAPPPAEPPPPSGLGTQRVAGIAVGAVGVLALGVGAGLGGAAIASNNSAKSACPTVQCGDQNGVDASHRAGTFADASTGLFVAGGVLAVTGLVVILTAPSKAKAPEKKAWIAPAVGAGFAGLSAGRTW